MFVNMFLCSNSFKVFQDKSSSWTGDNHPNLSFCHPWKLLVEYLAIRHCLYYCSTVGASLS